MGYSGKLLGAFQRVHAMADYRQYWAGNGQRINHRHGGRVWAEGKIDEADTVRMRE